VTTTVGQRVDRKSGFPRLVGRVSSLGRHRLLVTSLVIATIGGALIVDLAVPSYPIAGFYLVPATLAALTVVCFSVLSGAALIPLRRPRRRA
jgi:hypothetical protein